MNLAKVRSATGKGYVATALAVFVALSLPSSAAGAVPRVTIALLPQGTPPKRLARVPGIASGLIGASLGHERAAQAYLDITQGNRVFGGLYGGRLPNLSVTGGRVTRWRRVLKRSEDAPADIVPGLLASTLREHGIAIRASPGVGLPAIIAADRTGQVGFTPDSCPAAAGCDAGVTVVAATRSRLSRMVSALRRDDLLIALVRVPAVAHGVYGIGIAGRGFAGELISDSTRLRGLVLSTDIAPTILAHYRISVPSQVLGRSIRSEGSRDPAGIGSLGHRLAQITGRRAPVIGVNLLVWLVLVALAAVMYRARGARPALRLLALSVVYVPTLLLLGAALEPSRVTERLLVGAGAPLAAAVTLTFLRGYASLAFACAVSVLAYAADMVTGSNLTPLSLLGSNPALGVRFYGIGNELEATLTALVLIGTGAALTAWRPRVEYGDRTAAAAFVVVTAIAAAIFALGRFGADVGAAIVLPAGGVTAALILMRVRGRGWLVVPLAPLIGVGLLAAVDLISGGNSHLTRSVLHAGGLHNLGNVADRRLVSSANSFVRPTSPALIVLAFAAIGAGLFWRRRIEAWFRPCPAAGAGLLGAAAATVVGALANDSGALIVMIGTGYIAVFAGFAWAQPPQRPSPEAHEESRGNPAVRAG